MNATDQSRDPHTRRGMRGHRVAGAFRRRLDRAGYGKKFVDDYTAKFQKIPSLYGFSMFSGAMWVVEAIKEMGGKIDDRASLHRRRAEDDLTGSPLGPPCKLDAYGNPIYDVYIREGDEACRTANSGTCRPKPIQDVSQFWTYDPDTYMKQPPYSRTFQGMKKV